MSGRRLSALVPWPAGAAALQTQTGRATQQTDRKGLGGPGGPPPGRTVETGREAGEGVLDGIRLQ